MLVRMQFEGLDSSDYGMIGDFLNWLCDKIKIYINSESNRRKIELRLDYISKQKWIDWIGVSYLTTDEIIATIKQSIKWRRRKLTWEIYFDNRVMIPNTRTPITKLIAFLDHGDNRVKGTGMIQFLKRRFTFRQLNKWWLGYVMLKTNTFSSGRIISD